MVRTLRCCAFAAVILAVPLTGAAQPRGEHPHLRAALHELREGRAELKETRDTWPGGFKKRALASLDDAIKSLQTLLDVKDVEGFRGVDRKQDYYWRYSNYPRLRAALEDLREARDELRTSRTDFRGHRERALDDIDIAIGDILTLLRYTKR
jgi:hypothetical protein